MCVKEAEERLLICTMRTVPTGRTQYTRKGICEHKMMWRDLVCVYRANQGSLHISRLPSKVTAHRTEILLILSTGGRAYLSSSLLLKTPS